MIRAAIDLGSARIGLLIAEGDAAPLTILGWPFVLPVGRRIWHEVPIEKINAKGKIYHERYRREFNDDDEAAIVDAIVFAIIAAKVKHVSIESVAKLYAGKGSTPQEIVARANATKTAEGIGKLVSYRLRVYGGIEIVHVVARSWRAALQRYARANGEPLAEITGAGEALSPLLVAGYVGWPADAVADLGKDGAADVRDAAGLLLSTVLPIPEAARRTRSERAKGPRRPRGPRTGKGRKYIPIAKLLAVAPEKAKKRRARDALRQRKKRARDAPNRKAGGCTCPPKADGRASRHRKGCPMPMKARPVVDVPQYRKRWTPYDFDD